jgi:hypothetical protein
MGTWGTWLSARICFGQSLDKGTCRSLKAMGMPEGIFNFKYFKIKNKIRFLKPGIFRNVLKSSGNFCQETFQVKRISTVCASDREKSF